LLLEEAERRQPALHTAHAIAALLFLALAGLSPALSSIGFVALITAWLVRIPGTLKLNLALARVPVIWFGMAWTGWAALSGLWTAEGAGYASQLGSWRMVLVVPALWPVIRLWPALLTALVCGVSLQNTIQVLQQAELFPPHHGSFGRHRGIGGHPGHVATWTAASLLVIVAAGPMMSRDRRFWLAIPTGLALLGLAIAAARGAILGLLIALPVTVGTIVWRWGFRSTVRSLMPLMLAVAIATTAAVAITIIAGSDWENVRGQVVELNRVSTPGDAVGQRFVFWTAARELWLDHPLCGAGLGAFEPWVLQSAAVKRAIADYPNDKTLSQLLRAHHPHSVPLHALCELGVVGAVLAGSIAACTLVGAWRLARQNVLGCGVLGAAVLWIVAAQFDTLYLSGMTGGLGAVVVAIATLASRATRQE